MRRPCGTIAAALVLTTALVCPAQDNEDVSGKTWRSEYQARIEAAKMAEDLDRWYDAAAVYRELLREFVPYDPVLRVRLAKVLLKTDDRAAALAALDDAVQYGWTDVDTLLADEAFTALRETPEFKRIAARCRGAAAERVSVVTPPGAADLAKPRPLIIAFHGREGNNVMFHWHWRDAAARCGAVLAAPRGPNKLSPLMYGWDKPNSGGLTAFDDAGARRAVEAALSAARQQGAIDESRIVLVGYSQGAGVALRLAAENPARYSRVIAVNPVYGKLDLRAVREAKRKPQVFIYAGALDRLRADASAARDAWQEAGAAVHYDEAPNSGHEPPPDILERQSRALDALLKD